MSPLRQTLYRRAGWAVILAAFFVLVPAHAQRTRVSKGPRALGLIELAPNGKARLIPITILVDGKFYDAGAYKAAPVPMALESGTVYEAVRTGISQGLFTVTGAGQLKDAWIGEGTWQVAGAAPPPGAPRTAQRPRSEEDAPPVLRRPGGEKPKPAEPQAEAAKPAAAPPPEPEDKDRPVLRRGKPAEAAPATPLERASAPTPAVSPTPSKGAVQLMPAISDAKGPEPRPYKFDWKPEEEGAFRKKMLALAAEEVRARARQIMPAVPGTPVPARPRQGAVKSPPPSFEEVQLRAFDLSNSNEPVLVLSTRARLPRASAKDSAGELVYYVTLVTRVDLYGDLHKLFTEATDARHLDAIPRLELMDAVDADGDGRGELLFHQISQAGSAFAVYRVTSDRLWPLFEGTPAGQ